MANNFFIKHDNSARSDDKIQNLLCEEGYEGYGLYWALIEMLDTNDGYLTQNYKQISFILNCKEEKIKNIIQNFDLFKFEENLFFSVRLLQNLKERKKISKKASDNAKAGWRKRKGGMRPHSERIATAIQGEERRGEDRIEEDRRGQDIKKKSIKKKNPSILDITQEDKQEISDTYGVPLDFVESKYEDLELYLQSTGKKYKDYKATLRNWIKRDKDKLALSVIKKRPIFAKIR